ncbi:MAG: hypothetical protein H6993_06900 [Pseudomonadales bacterium]|nr:hypothetical protein [Pseudomonadales bacterium]
MGIRRVLAAGGLAAGLFAVGAQADLAPEKIPNSATVGTPYPASYVMVHDFAFSSIIDSSFSLVDIDTGTFIGMLSAGQFATLDFSPARQKFYVGETVHTKGARGERQDFIVVYDYANLKLVKEIPLQPRRNNSVVLKASTGITSDGRFLGVYNLNPGSSVTVIDLDSEAIVSEIEAAGCALVYPDMTRGFFMLCGDGTLLSVKLDEQGEAIERHRSEPVNDVDKDPLSEKASRINGTWYFVTYAGEVQPVDATGDLPVPGERWWLATEKERAANWRPAGWHGTAGSDSAGLLWVGMTPNGYPGSHKDPAPEVWVFDVEKKKRIERIKLRTPAISIAVTGEKSPRLVVANAEAALDVYDGRTGKHLNTVYEVGETPFQVHAVGNAN